MARRGAVTVTPGKVLAGNEPWTEAKLNQGFQPTAQVGAGEIGSDELVADDVRTIVTQMTGKTVVQNTDGTTPGTYSSADFRSELFYDATLVAGSSTVLSAGISSAAINGFAIIGLNGIQSGTTVNYTAPGVGTLSQPAVFNNAGTISALRTLGVLLNIFDPSDDGKTVTGDGIPAGTTMTYVNAFSATLSQDCTNGATTFQIIGKQYSGIEIQVVGYGKGWQLSVSLSGLGRLEAYAGAFRGHIAVGAFQVAPDGSFSLGAGATKFSGTKAGDFTWGSAPNSTTLDHNGNLYVGASTFADALMKVANNGNFTLLDVASAMHAISTGAVNPAVAPVIASPAGGAIVNPTNVSLNCQTKYSRIYSRSVAQDGVSTSASKTFTSATAVFTPKDVGKDFVCADYPAGSYIEKWNSVTSVDINNAATASHTALDFQITPDRTDTLYVDGTPISLTVSRRITARAFKNGEYSALGSWFFDTGAGATTVQNPFTDPVGGSYSGSSLLITLKDNTAASSIFYNKTFSSGGTPADPADPTHDGSLNPTGGATKVAIGATLTLAAGTTKIKLLAAKAGLTDSAIMLITFVVSAGSGGGGGGGGTGGGGGHSNV